MGRGRMGKGQKLANRILRKSLPFALVIIMICGLYLSVRPNLQVWKKEREQAKAVTEYYSYREDGNLSAVLETQTLEIATPEPSDPEPWPELRADLEQYNLYIYENGQQDLCDAFSYEDEAFDLREYGYENDVFGILTIESLDVVLPIRLGASGNNLDSGAAQMTQTSAPIGGENTHAVLAVHRNFIMDVEQIQTGDRIYIENPWETLEYRVVGCALIEPDERDPVLIQEGKDMITLLTCHPWGSGGRYRYLVYAERDFPAPSEEAEATETVSTISGVSANTEKENVPEGLVVSDGAEFISSRQDILMFRVLPVIAFGAVGLVFVVILAFTIAEGLRKRKME